MVVTWTYNAGTNTATASGAGSTNFAALVAADVAGGWGKFTADATGTQIICGGKIIYGDGTNALTFSDTSKQVIFTNGIATSQGDWIQKVKNNATYTLGVLVSSSLKQTKQGCSLISLDSTYANSYIITADSGNTVNLYSCQIAGYSTSRLTYIRYISGNIYNCMFVNAASIYTATVDMYNVYVGATSFGSLNLQGTFDLITVKNCTYGIYADLGVGVDITNKNTIISSCTYPIYFWKYAKSLYLVNCVLDSWAITFDDSASAKVYRQYEFDLVTDPSATVTLTDAASNEVFSVTSNAVTGAIATQTVSRGYYNQANGDTLQDYGPFTLTVSKAGKQTYTHPGIVLDEKIDWRIALHDEIIQVPSQGGVGKTRTIVKHVENPADIALLMATGVLLVRKRRLTKANKQLQLANVNLRRQLLEKKQSE